MPTQRIDIVGAIEQAYSKYEARALIGALDAALKELAAAQARIKTLELQMAGWTLCSTLE